MKLLTGACGAEGTLETTDHRALGVRRQIPIATLAVRLENEHGPDGPLNA